MEQGTFNLAGAEPHAPVKLCECGCGEPAPIADITNRKRGYVKGEPRRFVAGHNSKMMAAERAARLAEAPPPEPKLCECGCGEFTPIAVRSNSTWGHVQGQPVRFVRGHAARLGTARFTPSLDPADVPPGTVLCECGCGLPAPIARMTRADRGHVKGQPMRFISGHQRGPEGPKPKLRKLFAEVGQRIGKSTVIEAEISISCPTKPTIRAARLRCECGTEYVRALVKIFRDPETESCGCSRYADYTGQRFGMLTAIRRVGSERRRNGKRGPQRQGKWLCRCDCGNEVTVSRQNLVSGHHSSCGCNKHGPSKGFALGEAAFRAVLRGYQAGAEARGLSWNLSEDEFRRLTQLDCHYCGVEPRTRSKGHPTSGGFVYNGIDRIDSALGYEPDNVLPACKLCNYAKRDLPYEDFMAWVARLASFHFFSPDMTPARILAPPA